MATGKGWSHISSETLEHAASVARHLRYKPEGERDDSVHEHVSFESALDLLAQPFPRADDAQRLIAASEASNDGHARAAIDHLPADLTGPPPLHLTHAVVR